MRYRKLDDSGDFMFGHGQAYFHHNTPEAVAQAVATRLRLFSGEWFLDVTEGTPYVQAVFGKHTAQTYGPALRERILDTEGVTGLAAFETVYDGEERRLTVNATIETVYGEAVVQEVL